MHRIVDPGTITDLVADAASEGHEVTARMIRDWTEVGLLDYPRRRAAGRGHGSKAALYAANQRMLFLAMLSKRATNKIPSLARIPVALWIYWGDDYVPLRQAHRAFATWLGGAKASKRQSKRSAEMVLMQLDHGSTAAPHARRELLTTITDLIYTGRVDPERLERAVRTVFEPASTNIRRAVGHPAAALTSDSITGLIRVRIAAVKALRDGQVTDELFFQARQEQLISVAAYQQHRVAFAASAPVDRPDMYEEVTDETKVISGCNHLLTIIGVTIQRSRNVNPLFRNQSDR